MRIMSWLSTLWRGQRGNVSVTVALLMLPMTLVSGGAIDFVRAIQQRNVVQQAADAAALASAARLSKASETAEQTQAATDAIVTPFYTALANQSGVTLKEKTVTIDTVKNSIRVSFKTGITTSFLGIAGLRSLELTGTAEALRAKPGSLNLALVLDITASMEDPLNGTKKITTMKQAAQGLVDTVMVNSSVKVGVMPFLHYINLGTRYAGKSWLKVPSPTLTGTSCSYPYATGCSWQPKPCDSGTCQVWSCTNPGPLVCTNQYRYWTGCIGVRPQAYHGSIDNPVTVPYSGFVNSFDTACGPEALPLSNDIAQVRSTISGLYTQGNTFIPGGLLWGWNMLTPDEPMAEADTAAQLEAKGGQRVLVLMTDGMNTYSPQNATSIFTLPHASTTYKTGTYTDTLTASLCTSIKQQGIIIYTVLFDEANSAMQQMMKDCASSPDNAFLALSTQGLLDAFQYIAVRLQKVRLLN